MKRLLVTGATGFLGRHVIERALDVGLEVTAHGKTRTFRDVHGTQDSRFGAVESIVGDLSDEKSAAELLGVWRWDTVVNLAGPVTGGNEDLRTGIAVITEHERIALHVRRFAQDDTQVVHASSMTVYGMPEQVDVAESHPTRPQHLYGLAKLVAEDIMLAAPNLRVQVLRLPGLFSEQRTSGALYHFCRAARAGEPIRITTPVPTPWNILHVDDAAQAVIAALSSPFYTPQRGGPYNVSYDEPIELVAIARVIAAIAGTGSLVESVAGVVHPPLRLVASRAKQLFGFNPPSLRDRLTKLYEDYAAA